MKRKWGYKIQDCWNSVLWNVWLNRVSNQQMAPALLQPEQLGLKIGPTWEEACKAKAGGGHSSFIKHKATLGFIPLRPGKGHLKIPCSGRVTMGLRMEKLATCQILASSIRVIGETWSQSFWSNFRRHLSLTSFFLHTTLHPVLFSFESDKLSSPNILHIIHFSMVVRLERKEKNHLVQFSVTDRSDGQMGALFNSQTKLRGWEIWTHQLRWCCSTAAPQSQPGVKRKRQPLQPGAPPASPLLAHL